MKKRTTYKGLNEFFFEYSSQIKQKRLNRFVEILEKYFIEGSDINIENIKTENFNDLFESVLRKVVQTKSELKLIRFKDILIRELNSPSENAELNDHYLDLISNLTEMEISILYNHRYFTMEYEEKINELNRLNDNLSPLTRQLGNAKGTNKESDFQKPYEDLKKYIDSLSKYKHAEFYELSENSFMFYKQRLFSKGLLIDDRMKRIGSLPFVNMGITEFGIEFIDFIKNSDK